MVLKKILPILLFLIILNYNYAYSVGYQQTEISIYEFDTYKIKDSLLISDINESQLIFDIVPCYDLIVKINNQRYSSISYNTEKLTININEELKGPKTTNIEIIYLTDYYTSKQNGIWTLNITSIYKEKIDELKITLPKNAKILETPYSTAVQIINKQLYVSLKDISEIKIDYQLSENYNSPNYFIIVFFILLAIVLVFLISKKKRIIKPKMKSKNNDLLLGLNENEQKIIKVIIENEGQTQKTITAKSFLPKGTVSRNIKKLSDKGYIEIKKYGVSNKIFLGEIFNKK